jgi:integrase
MNGMSTEAGPVQYCMFDANPLEDLGQLRSHQENLLLSNRAENTLRAYAGRWKCFADWCRNWRYCEPLPASPAVLRDFLTWGWQIQQPAYKPATLQLTLFAVAHYHRAAGLAAPIDKGVWAILRGILRQAARAGRRPETDGKRHLSVELLRRIYRSLDDSPMGLRDRVIVLTGFASALRRCDLAKLDTRQLRFENGRVHIWLPYSKTDQLGVGRLLALETAKDPLLCPVRALEAWQKLRLSYFGNFRGPLLLRCSPGRDLTPYPLAADSIRRIVQIHIERAGERRRDYGAHSLRSGMITCAHEAGANLRSIMEHGGIKTVETVMRYVKPNRGANPLANVL